MIRTLAHRIEVYETPTARSAWRAACECGWESIRYYFDSFDGIDTPDEFIDPAQQAWDAAMGAAQAHVEAVTA